MTKFEEELNKKMDSKEVPMYFTQSGCSMTRKTYIETNWIFDNYKNWHSDEEFQAKEKEIKRLRKINHLYKKAKGNAERLSVDRGERLNQAQDELASLKSQLQQQALPVVPECVGEFIEDCKKERDCLFGIFADATRVERDMPDLVYFWLGDEGNNDELFARAWLNGYQVEKPQLFYLKNKLTTSYLILDTSTGYFEHWGSTEATGRYKSEFTQQEIDSMETGSYEKIEVAE